MRVVALFRVSSDQQAERGASLDAQARTYDEQAARGGWETVARLRGVESATGAASERRVLQQALAAVRDGADALWVYEQSRLTRGDELEVALLLRELRERRVTVLVCGIARDLGSIDDRTALRLQAVLDRAEVERFAERVSRGKREKARRGLRVGGIAPYGYRNPPPGDPRRGTLQPQEPEASWVRRIFAWAAEGTPERVICSRLGAAAVPAPRGGRWARSTLRQLLSRPVYLGTAAHGVWSVSETGAVVRDLDRPGSILVEDAHKALVDRETWERAQARPSTGGGTPRLLTGILYLDGERAVADATGGRSCYRPRGGGPWLPAEAAEREVWSATWRALRDEALVAELLAAAGDAEGFAAEAEVERLRMERRRLERRLGRLVDLVADGVIGRDAYAERRDATRRQLAAISRSLRGAERADPAGVYAVALAAAAMVDDLLEDDARRRLLHAAAERVDLSLDRLPQPRVGGGRYAPGARWAIREAVLWPRGGGPAVSSGGCGRSPASVLIIGNGAPVLLRGAA